MYQRGIMKIFGERLKELRTEKNLSTRDLAKEIETSNGQIVRWENNKTDPSITQLRKVAVYFKVSSDYLIGLED